MKKWRKKTSFLDNIIGCRNFFLLWREYLLSAVNPWTNSPKNLGLPKKDVYQLNLSQNDDTIRWKYSSVDFSSVLNP